MTKTAFSPIIAGTMTWGAWGKRYTTRQMTELIHGCLEQGISSFDHADIYGDYTTESEFGKAFRESGISRDKIQLISKCGIQMVSANRNNTVKHYDYSAAYITWSVEQSLKNLHTDHLDLLLLHRPSPLMQPAEIARAVEQLKQEGKILDFGVSNFTPSQTDWIETGIKINYNQVRFSITDFEAMLDGSLDHMQTKGITPMAWSPLGTFFSRTGEEGDNLKSLVARLAVKYDVPDHVLLLAWIFKHPAGILPVCGTADPARIAQLMNATKIDLELQDWFALWSESAGKPVP